MLLVRRVAALALVAPLSLAAQTKVGPAHGTVIVVGGGAMGPEVYSRFIEAAGGPNALIIDVPTANSDSDYTQTNAPGLRGWRNAGAKNVYVLHTHDRKLADVDSFVAMVDKAGGVWFEGGRQYRLVDAYGGTKSEAAFNALLARGGVIGGSSAGASILGDFLVRGAPSNDNFIMDSPKYEKGFAYLKGVGIDQHVIARERLPDLADSLVPKYPNMLFISEDEGTAWVVKGDTATIVGRDKAFVYGGKDAPDAGKPFLTLYPGDKYDLAARRVVHRAKSDSPVSEEFINSLVQKYSSAKPTTVLVARDGEVFADLAYAIPDQARYMPRTTVPQFDLGAISDVFKAICDQLPPPRAGRGGGRRGNAPPLTPFQTCVATGGLATPVGFHKTTANVDGVVSSDVDELYRLALGLEHPTTFRRDTTAGAPGVDLTQGWQTEPGAGGARLAAYGLPGGKRDAFVRVPERHATVIVLTSDDNADAKAIANQIMDRLLGGKS